MLPRPRFILFDWGGTLVDVSREPDTYPRAAASACAAMRGLGISLSRELSDNFAARFAARLTQNNTVDNQTEWDSTEFLRDWARENDVTLPESLDAVVEALWAPWVGCLDPMGDVRTTLSALRECGIALGLVSNCAAIPTACRAEITRQGLADRFDFTLFSSEVGVRKPHPDIYDVALARAAQCNGHGNWAAGDFVFVGDTPAADIAGPAQQGMRTVLVRTGNWTGDASKLEPAPDLIVDSVHDLPAIWT